MPLCHPESQEPLECEWIQIAGPPVSEHGSPISHVDFLAISID